MATDIISKLRNRGQNRNSLELISLICLELLILIKKDCGDEDITKVLKDIQD